MDSTDQPGNEVDTLHKRCWTESLYCYGTSFIFEVRANRLRRRIRLLTFLGIALPASVGAAFMSWGAGSVLTSVFVTAAALLGLLQLVASIWSLTNRWDDAFAYASESLSGNRYLFEQFKALAEGPPPDLAETKQRLDLLTVEAQGRSRLDEQQGITEEEKRMGMCAALRQMSRECVGCKRVPRTLETSDCGVCGNFKIRRW